MKLFRRKSNNKTIASTIINGTGLFVFGVIIILAVASLIFQYNSTIHILKDFLRTEVYTAAGRVSWAVRSYKNIIEGIGTIPELSRKDFPLATKEMLLKNKVVEFGLSYCQTINLNGYSEMDGVYRGDRDYFRMASSGKVVVSDPIISRTNGQLMLIVAAPVWKAGIYKGTVDSVVYGGLKPKIFNDIIENLQISKNSDAYIIDREGTVVSAINNEIVLKRNNNILNANTDSRYNSVANIEMKFLGGDNSVQIVRRGLSLHCYASYPIDETPGWTLIIEAPIGDYMQTFYVALLFMMALAVGAILLSLRQTLNISRRISVPVEKMAIRLKKAAVGDFSSEVDFDDSLDEVKTISEAIQILINRMDVVINGNESFKLNSHLGNIFNFGELSDLQKLLNERMHASLIITDNQAQILLGNKDIAAVRSTSASIVVNNQKLGTCTMCAEDACTLETDTLDAITKVMAMIFGKISEVILQKESHFDSWCENLAFNTKTLVAKTELISHELTNWLAELEKENVEIGSANSEIYSKIWKTIAQVNESTEYARFADFESKFAEADYNVKELIANIKEKMASEVADKNQCKFFAAENLPEFLFGDSNAISRIVVRLVSVFAMRNKNSPIDVNFSSEMTTFGAMLGVKISVKECEMPEEETGRLIILIKQLDSKNEKMSLMEQKLIGALRQAREMNCDFGVDSDNNIFSVSISIPQLPLKG